MPATGRGNRARVQRHTEAFVAVKCRGAAAVLDPRDRGLDDARALASERGGLAGQNKTSRSGQHHDATSAAGVLGFLSIFVRAVCSGAVETTARTVVVRQFRRRSQRRRRRHRSDAGGLGAQGSGRAAPPHLRVAGCLPVVCPADVHSRYASTCLPAALYLGTSLVRCRAGRDT